MCCCDPHPNVNGQPGYKWQPNDAPSVRPVSPPDVPDGHTLVYDAPGRCGGLDAHCHHFRVVTFYSSWFLLVRHGGGTETVKLPLSMMFAPTLAALDETARFWLLHAFYSTAKKAQHDAASTERHKWTRAASEGRIKTRKQRNSPTVKVWIEHSTRWETLTDTVKVSPEVRS